MLNVQYGNMDNLQKLLNTNDKSILISPPSKKGFFLQIWKHKRICSNNISRSFVPLHRKMALRKIHYYTVGIFSICDLFELVIFSYGFLPTIFYLFGHQLVFLSILLFEARDFCNELIEVLSFSRNSGENTYDKDLAYHHQHKTLLRLGGADVKAASSKAQKGFVDYYRLSYIKTKTALLDNAALTRDTIAQMVYFSNASAGRRCRGIEIDPGYAAVALRRWEELTGETAERIRNGE